MREFKKGSLSLLVLHQLYEGPSYGWELCQRLRERSDGTVSFEDGAVYPLLHSFERDGLVEGYWESNGQPIPVVEVSAAATIASPPRACKPCGPRCRSGGSSPMR